MKPFRDRADAGLFLAEELKAYADMSDVVVLALPRGGVPVAAVVAKRLGLSLDVVVVRKLGLPGQEELAMGAIASGGRTLLNIPLIRSLGIPAASVEKVVRREEQERARREALYRGERPPIDLKGRTVILIDDGLATGATMLAAARAARADGAKRVVVAVPVAARAACSQISREVDEVYCGYMPEPFHAVGAHYERFDQTTDEEILELLAERRESER
ncbi:MAG: phosphoribosyltransferase family protein [Candidatus Eisenbacteria bacterium]|nr:phosphoribosyltransferase family protein [Candidatus Eisenbacteria bacterium]